MLLLSYPIYFAVGLNVVQIVFVLSGPNDPGREKRQVGPPMSSVDRRMRTVVGRLWDKNSHESLSCSCRDGEIPIQGCAVADVSAGPQKASRKDLQEAHFAWPSVDAAGDSIPKNKCFATPTRVCATWHESMCSTCSRPLKVGG
jgi:hypothetical protein